MNNAMYWVELIAAILGGLAVCIPVVARLVVAGAGPVAEEKRPPREAGPSHPAVKEKNWPQIVEIVLALMTDAEGLFADGAARKAWIMQKVEQAAKSVNYDYDDAARQKVSDMIDKICDAAKVVNGEGKAD